jgi:hypothetical protein
MGTTNSGPRGVKSRTIRIESLIKNIFERFENVSEVHVDHMSSASEVTHLHITVHTGEAMSLQQNLDLTTASEVTVDMGEPESLSLPFEVMATFDGPGHIEGIVGTTIYRSDDIMGAESRDLKTGLSMLRQKLSGKCPSCGTAVESLSNHYRESRACLESERV